MKAKGRAFWQAAVVAIVMVVAGAMRASPAHAAQQAPDLAGAKSAIGRFVGALKANDAAAAGKILIHDPDMVAFGTDKAERWVGYDQIMKALHAQLAAFQTTNVSVQDEVVHVLPSNSGAYFSEVWDWSIRSEGKDMVLKDVRVTGVLVHRDGRWLVAQFHMSLPVGGQAVPY